MRSPRPSRIAELLLKSGVIDAPQLQTAIAKSERWGGRIAHLVVEMGLADEDRVQNALAGAFRVPRIRLASVSPDAETLTRIEASYAEERAVFPTQLTDDGKVLSVAMADPSDLETIDDLQRRARARVIPSLATEREIRSAIARHYYGRPDALDLPASEYQGEITSLSGADVHAASPALPDPAVPRPAAATPPERSADRPPTAAALLNEMFRGRDGSPPRFTSEELARIQAVHANQARSAAIVRAIGELLMEKGFLTAEELQRRLASQGR